MGGDMIPIKGTQITSAVCKAINGKYSQIPIYLEPIDQDFQEPCFFVWCSSTETNPVIWPKFKETHHIEVRYYPQERNSQHGDGLNMGAELVEILAKIVIQDPESQSLPIFATDYSRRIVDDSVAVSITYKTEGFFYEARQESMGDITASINTKE
jgi:hypothetical protein